MLVTYSYLFVVAILQCSAVDERGRNRLRTSILFFPNNIQGTAPKHHKIQNLSKLNKKQADRIKIQLYYEFLCPYSKEFFTRQFKRTVDALGPYLDIYLYPYGNAETKTRNGKVEIICQHGRAECYGNKLHACAVDHLDNIKTAVSFNSCLMDSEKEGKGSYDRAVDVCARTSGIKSEPIKQCAKGQRGTNLLRLYGKKSEKANFDYVPYILINGVESRGDNFIKNVCKALRKPPAVCNKLAY